MSQLERRDLLKLGAAGSAVGFAAMMGSWVPAGVNEGSYEILENGAGKFRVEIGGLPVASANVESITMEDLVIDEREGAPGESPVPGNPRFGSITLRVFRTQPNEIEEWFSQAASGIPITRDISIVLPGKRDRELRRFNCFECFPTRWDPGEYSPSSNVAVETIVCKMGRVELA